MQSPPPNADDDISYKRNIDHLNTERKKTKPRAAVLKELMCRTFPSRWEEYTNGTDLPLSAYLERFPLLKKAAYVSSNYYCFTTVSCLIINFIRFLKILLLLPRMNWYEISLRKMFCNGVRRLHGTAERHS